MKPEDIKIQVYYEPAGFDMKAIVTATHIPTKQSFSASERSAHRARDLAVEGLRKLFNAQQVCRSPYCECPLNECSQGKVDMRGTYPEYETAPLNTQPPNPYQKVVDDTLADLASTSREAAEHAVVQVMDLLMQEDKKIKYLTSKLQEEAAEVIQAVSKINRFGENNHHPDRTASNLEELVGEVEDFLAIISSLQTLKYFDLSKSQQNIQQKAATLLS